MQHLRERLFFYCSVCKQASFHIIISINHHVSVSCYREREITKRIHTSHVRTSNNRRMYVCSSWGKQKSTTLTWEHMAGMDGWMDDGWMDACLQLFDVALAMYISIYL